MRGLAIGLALALAGTGAQAGGPGLDGRAAPSQTALTSAEESRGEPVASASSPDPAAPVSEAADRLGAVTSGGSFYVEWWPEPEAVPLNEVFEIRFRVLEPDDRVTPVAGAALTADAWMPDHDHGSPLQPRIEALGDGTFVGRGFLLQMEGRWELRVGVAARGTMERAVFEIDL